MPKITEEELDKIQAEFNQATKGFANLEDYDWDDVIPHLIAEVRRLTAVLEKIDGLGPTSLVGVREQWVAFDLAHAALGKYRKEEKKRAEETTVSKSVKAFSELLTKVCKGK